MFIVISGAIMSPHGHKKILMRAVNEKQVISLQWPKDLSKIPATTPLGIALSNAFCQKYSLLLFIK